MGTKRKPFRSNQVQREDLTKIKTLLAEMGYMIFTPVRRMKRNPHDFLAIKDRHGFLFRVGRIGIEVRPYWHSATFYTIVRTARTAIKRACASLGYFPHIREIGKY